MARLTKEQDEFRRYKVRGGLLPGSDPNGFELRNHPANSVTMNAAMKHEQQKGHTTMDLMDDQEAGDVCVGLCCYNCDWMRTFAFKGRRRQRTVTVGRRPGKTVR